MTVTPRPATTGPTSSPAPSVTFPPERRPKWLNLVGLALLTLLLAACQLSPPVSISERESLVGQGQVIRVTNTSDRILREIRVRVTGPDGGEAHEHFESRLGPGEELEVGWLKLEGWPVPKGASVSVTAKGYTLAARHDG